MPETASSDEQDIRYTLLGPNFFAKYILTLKKDPRHWSGNPRTPKGNCKLIIWINLLIFSGGCLYRHTVLYEQRPNRIDKRIFCLSLLIYQKTEKNKGILTYFLTELLPWGFVFQMQALFLNRNKNQTTNKTAEYCLCHQSVNIPRSWNNIRLYTYKRKKI